MEGFLILNCIVGGQTLAGVSHHLTVTLGIVIIGILSLAVSALVLPCGFTCKPLSGNIFWIQGDTLVKTCGFASY